jgi:hypothetical protein
MYIFGFDPLDSLCCDCDCEGFIVEFKAHFPSHLAEYYMILH